MPIISSIGSSSATTGAPQKADLKPIGICLPSNSTIEMSNSSTTLAPNRVTTNTSNANFYTNSSQGPSVGALSVMVARFSADANSRQQTVILHPRPINSGNRPALQVSAALRGQTVISGQTISTTGSTPSLTSSSASISVRTTHLIGGQQHPSNAVPLLNLQNVSNANTSAVSSHSASAVKQLCTSNRPFITTSGALPIESVSLVMANPNDSNVVNARPIRLHQTTNDLKSNTIHNINKISGPRTAVLGSTLMATQPTKMAISIGGSGAQTATTVPTHVARVGIIGQLPMGSGANTAANKSGIINLTKGQFIFNSASAPNMNSGTTLHNMVNVSGSVASFSTTAQSSQNTKLSVNSSANNVITSRHSLVSTSPFIQQNVSNVSQHISQHTQPSNRSAVHQNANINSSQTPSTTQSQQSLQPTTTVSSASPLRPTILSSPVSSPVKQSQLQTSTPSSPRPSILIRKRIANDSHTGITPTALFKQTAPNSAMTGSTTPVRAANYGLKPNDSPLSQTNSDNNRVNDCLTTNDNNVGLKMGSTLPTTPNSEGNQTPRKKPRKQLLEPSSLKTSQNIRLLNNSANTSKDREVINDKESVVRINKKPRVSLLSTYNMGWKSLQYHFLRYSDVRPKPEKKLTLSELSNEGLQRRNGWKIHHLATQMEVMSDNEESVYRRLTEFLDTFEKDVVALNGSQCSTTTTTNSSNTNCSNNTNNNINNNLSVCELNSRTLDSNLDSITVKLNDLIRGNLQRSNLFAEQISEARQLIIKLTNDHKERVGKITKKCANKRTYITK